LCRLYGLTGGTLSAYIVGLWCGVGCIVLGVWGYVSEVSFYTWSRFLLVSLGVGFVLFWWGFWGLIWCRFAEVDE